jgi:hypothetical protein
MEKREGDREGHIMFSAEHGWLCRKEKEKREEMFCEEEAKRWDEREGT